MNKLIRKLVLNNLTQSTQLAVCIEDAIGTTQIGDTAVAPVIKIKDMRTYAALFWQGSMGAAKSFIKGWWHCDQLSQLLAALLLNQSTVARVDQGWLQPVINALGHIFTSRRSLNDDKAFILAHYDLGNAFFELFLDPTMMYSCAEFEVGMTLEQASTHKLSNIAQSLQCNADDHVLEIGSGWGGCSIFLAKQTGCKVTTTTISDAQYQYCCERVVQEGLSDQITVLNQDFRHLTGSFDHIVSIEMIEAIGLKAIPSFFEVCQRHLKPQGKLLIQAITMNEQYFKRYQRQQDFIQRIVFPGGALPSISLLQQSAVSAGDFKLRAIKDISQHYVLTLEHWSNRLLQQQEALIAQGFDQSFIRTFEYYFKYCQAGFACDYIGDYQLLYQRIPCLN